MGLLAYMQQWKSSASFQTECCQAEEEVTATKADAERNNYKCNEEGESEILENDQTPGD